jgi:alpha,alpha-trehalose phosphorylase
VIYRYQVIKQADIVLAMFLLGDEFSAEQKRRNFEYYDPLTTGDSSLSACVQSIVCGRDRRGTPGPRVLQPRLADGPCRHCRQRLRRSPRRGCRGRVVVAGLRVRWRA